MCKIHNDLKANFTKIPNIAITDTNLTDSDFRLLIYLYSLPDGWEINQETVGKILGCSRKNVCLKISRLKKYGYLELVKNGTGYDYNFPIPIYAKSNVTENGIPKNGITENGIPKNETHNNTIYSKTKINNTILTNNKEILNKETVSKNDTPKKYFENEEINNLFLEFLEVRKKIKAINSERAINMLIKKLNGYNDFYKKKMLEKSIVNCWKDVYEIQYDKLSKEEKSELDDYNNEIVGYEIVGNLKLGIQRNGKRVAKGLIEE